MKFRGGYNIEERSRKHKGLTKKKYKKMQGSKSQGEEKGGTCKASPLDKAMAKYPRSIRTAPEDYISFNKKKDKEAGRTNTFFSNL